MAPQAQRAVLYKMWVGSSIEEIDDVLVRVNRGVCLEGLWKTTIWHRPRYPRIKSHRSTVNLTRDWKNVRFPTEAALGHTVLGVESPKKTVILYAKCSIMITHRKP